jgi:hypothetical protein
MSPSQKKAVARHRERQQQKGIVRLEINVPEQDRSLLRAAAAELRSGGLVAGRVRQALQSVLANSEPVSFKEFLESAPMEGVEFERSRDSGREIQF